ncbi:MAG: hypothetical protein JJT77_07560, partial [Crocinitomicaceae bacterium]|nr:hypothetical protein [Crocinitomicaceae bacterium]
MKNNLFVTFLFTLTTLILFSQNLGVNEDGTLPDSDAILDIKSENKGLLVPRVTLTNTTSSAPLSAGLPNSILVFNTATVNDVVPGYYYWDGSAWLKLISSADDDYFWNLEGNEVDASTHFLGSTNAANLNFRTDDIQRAQINSAGLFGINTSNQETFLDVRSSTFKGTTAPLEYLMQIGSANSSNPLAMQFGLRTHNTPTNRYGAIQMQDGSFFRPLILNPDGGNVGVNWSNPLSALDVRNDINKGDNVAASFPFTVGTANNAPLAIRLGLASSSATANRYGIIEVDDAGSKRNLSIQPDGGNTGVNWTSPQVKLDVRSDADKTVTAATDYAFQVGTSNNDPLAVRLGVSAHNTATSRFGVVEVDDNGAKRDLLLQPEGGNVGIGVNGIVGSKLYVNDADGNNLTLERSSTTTGHFTAQYFKVHTGTTSGNRKGAIFFERTAGNGRGN